jgi:hypothetical protein
MDGADLADYSTAETHPTVKQRFLAERPNIR